MANYFRTLNDDGTTVQISDTYQGIHITRSGTITATVKKGQLYGMVINNNESCVAYHTTNDVIIVSPIVVYNGQKVQYVGSIHGTPIQYRVLTDNTNITVASHNYGLELYNANGKIIFSSNNECVDLIGSVYENATSHLDYSGLDISRASWVSHSFPDPNQNTFIIPIACPFGSGYAVESWWSGSGSSHFLRACLFLGFKFADNTVSNVSSALTVNDSNFGYKQYAQINSLSGGGSLSQIGTVYGYDEWRPGSGSYECAGVWCAVYMYNVIRILSDKI